MNELREVRFYFYLRRLVRCLRLLGLLEVALQLAGLAQSDSLLGDQVLAKQALL